MRKARSLKLRKETIRELSGTQMVEVIGGAVDPSVIAYSRSKPPPSIIIMPDLRR